MTQLVSPVDTTILTVMSETNLPLPQFYARALRTLLPVVDGTLPPLEDSTHAQLQRAIDDLYLVGRMLSSLGVFSDNEGIDEVGEKELVFMTVGWTLGEAEARLSIGGPEARKAALERSDTAFTSFLSVLETYKLVPGGAALPADPGQRREAKIAAFRRSKELREKISTALPGHPDAGSNPLAFILGLLPSDKPSRTSVNEEEPDVREPALLLLGLLADLTAGSLSNNAMELEILAHAPEPTQGPLQDPRARRTEEPDGTWRLDRAPGQYKPRELISGGGRVLRPFTILPSTSAMSDRERLRADVFRSGHRLPTMTIDEYLAEEDRRGNIIRGGGQASYDAPTESELLELEMENDGTAGAEEAEEKKRLKDENWAQFTDDNEKGAGNTMNRG
ncbi:hypothetical protein CspeluHIS016_0900300 [Cutaneotrichosporon spelunceum]|uniref:TAP42-like protein n=1 Tax=Cutaneotrichosporon spelunceum TaxID=1672016 RepID=A0AAD3YF49_9TREE|nr:hypothetical protein CspeluHIS016_0900300 [Cutaneotrichosporon spelunceum]